MSLVAEQSSPVPPPAPPLALPSPRSSDPASRHRGDEQSGDQHPQPPGPKHPIPSSRPDYHSPTSPIGKETKGSRVDHPPEWTHNVQPSSIPESACRVPSQRPATPTAPPVIRRRRETRASLRERAAKRLRYWLNESPSGIKDDWSEATSRAEIPVAALKRFWTEHPEVLSKGSHRVEQALWQWVRIEGRSPGTHALPSRAVEALSRRCGGPCGATRVTGRHSVTRSGSSWTPVWMSRLAGSPTRIGVDVCHPVRRIRRRNALRRRPDAVHHQRRDRTFACSSGGSGAFKPTPPACVKDRANPHLQDVVHA